MKFFSKPTPASGFSTGRHREFWSTSVGRPPAKFGIVKAELLHGAEKSAARERVLQKLQGFFARFPSMPFDDRAAGGYGEIRAALEKSGNVIGPNDLLIAAIEVGFLGGSWIEDAAISAARSDHRRIDP